MESKTKLLSVSLDHCKGQQSWGGNRPKDDTNPNQQKKNLIFNPSWHLALRLTANT